MGFTQWGPPGYGLDMSLKLMSRAHDVITQWCLSFEFILLPTHPALTSISLY